MPWAHVYAPARGMVTHIPSTLINKALPGASPYIKGMYIKNGVATSDFGTVEFPTAGALKTNYLNGAVMYIDQFYTEAGLGFLLAFTTTNIYEYNTSTNTWDCITQGVTVEDCEDIWDVTSGEIVSTADTTYKLRGTYSVKLALSADASTGIMAYENFSSADLSGYTHMHFWIRSDIAVSAADLSLRISEQNAGGTGADYEDIDIPALSANEWTPVCVAFAGATTTRDAVLSVALIVNTDNGAQTVYLDDIRAVKAFTGDEDNRFSTAYLNDTYMCSNGVDQPQKITESGGVLTVADLDTNLAAGSITTSEVLFSFKDHVLFMNNTENGADAPFRVSWTNIGTIDEHTTGTAGYQDLIDDQSWIVGAELLSENEVIIYKERSIVKMVWVGGHTPFRFYTMVYGTGALNKECISGSTGLHTVLGPDYIYEYTGGEDTASIDEAMKGYIYDRLDLNYANRAFLMYLEEDDELQVWAPTDNAFADEQFCYNTKDKNWYLRSKQATGYGFYQEQSALTIGDMIGTIGEQTYTFGSTLTKSLSPITLIGDANGKIYKIDKTTYNLNGSAITNTYETPDFVLPGTDQHMNFFMRVMKLIFEVSGIGVSCYWSDDSGSTWNPAQGAGTNVVSLDSVYKLYELDFDTVLRKIRFKFENTSVSSGFSIRYYGFYWKERSSRR